MFKNVFIKTFGCQMNIYDSKKILSVLNDFNDIKEVNKRKRADIIIINTCSIREKAKEKVFSELGRLSKLKNKKPDLLICVGGCLVVQEGKNIIKRSPCVDIIFKPKTLNHLPKMIKQYENNNFKKKINFFKFKKICSIKNISKNTRAYISIIEGCNKYCSYCIVPYTRGKEISRSINDILNEVKNLVLNGVKEIILLGQNVNAFMGQENNKKKDLSYLINKISCISQIKRIQFITSYPKNFTDKLINTYYKNKKLVNHLYLPVQHGSNKILKKMNRDYSIEDYKLIIDKIKKIRPNISISSDFIIGFPGETEKDFNELVKLIYEIKFDTSYSFIFSPRPGTKAKNFFDNTPYIIKKKRLKYIQSIIKKNTYEINKKLIGSKQNVLVEGTLKKDPTKLIGRTENNKIVNFDKNKDKCNLIGKIIPIKIINISKFNLIGKRII